MTQERRLEQYLEDILDAAGKAGQFAAGMTFGQFAGDAKTVYAVVRALEIVGEAAKKVTPSVRARYPDVPWREMAGIRDKLIHDYDRIDLQVVWDTVQHDLSPLREAISRVLADLEEERA